MGLKILFLADIVGKPGRKAAAKFIAEQKNKLAPDLIIANAENLAHGKGVTAETLQEMCTAGIDYFTSGNHIWKKTDVFDLIDNPDNHLIRPANYPDETPGRGYVVANVKGKKILIINLLGRVFIKEDADCPFKIADKILAQFKNEKLDAIIVDIHGEATSEKRALGFYLDGRVSAVIGTHTHVPTCDQQILENGTAYVSDAGMVGIHNSVLGIEKENIIKTFLTQIPYAHQLAERGLCVVNSLLLEINPHDIKAKDLQRVDTLVKI